MKYNNGQKWLRFFLVEMIFSSPVFCFFFGGGGRGAGIFGCSRGIFNSQKFSVEMLPNIPCQPHSRQNSHVSISLKMAAGKVTGNYFTTHCNTTEIW